MSQKKPAPIEGLVFDMDGLLVDSEKIVQRSWEHVGKILGYPDIGSHIYHTIGMNVVGREEYFRKHIAEDFPMEKFTAMTRQKFHEIVDTEGLDIKPGAKELLMRYEAYKTSCTQMAESLYNTHFSTFRPEKSAYYRR